eukprot:CAMPEP_0117537886 /NCGR_PEP_ID=MMETSP0784-20121206/42198_1 /TAXON_ID=39447 /ORGANISM="" /LENGTH=338 /DNA_ID=CAMNT_0005334491 /DNA_START=43 /DNA_END=1059 /DNA_ORIENTATION=-
MWTEDAHRSDCDNSVVSACLPPDLAEDWKVQQFAGSQTGMRRGSVSAAPLSMTDIDQFQPPVYGKSYEEVARIKQTIAEKPALQVLFGSLHTVALDAVVSAMFLRHVQVGEVVIQQGADGDFFYIVDSGVFDISVHRYAEHPPERVMVAHAGMSFGELALMYNVPRAATVVCVEAGGLWCLERDCFQKMLVTAGKQQEAEHVHLLAQIDVLRTLKRHELGQLSDMLTSELFDAGEEIVRQGEVGDSVFFLSEGECKAYIAGDQGEVEVRHYANQGDYFGEISLLTSEPRRATVRASGEGCVVLKLLSKDVDLTIGAIGDRLRENIEQYPQYESFLAGT